MTSTRASARSRLAVGEGTGQRPPSPRSRDSALASGRHLGHICCVPYLIELLLFLMPFAAYGLWRKINPHHEPSTVLLVLAGIGVALMLAGAFWFGLSRSMPPGTTYVPAHLEGDHIEPGHAEPRR